MKEDLQNKKEQLEKINRGRGIQYILNEAYRILGNPILTHNMEYKVMACTENTVADDPIWNEFETTGMVGHDRLIFYKQECFFEMAADAKKITFLLSDKLKYDRIYGKLLTNNNIQVGCMCMVACYKPFGADDSDLFEIVCDILSEELCKSEFYQNYGQAYMEILVRQLMEGSLGDISLHIAKIESIYVGLKSNLRVAVVDISQSDPAHTKLAYYRDLLKQAKPDFKYVIYAKYILIIMSSNNRTLHVENLNKLYMIFEQNNLYAGMSGIFENIFELPQYYKEAVNALNYGVQNHDGQQLFLYDDIADLLPES